MSNSDTLCKELYLKLLIDPPVSTEFIKFLRPTVTNIEYYSCKCSECCGKDMLQLKLNYADNTAEVVIVSSNTAGIIRTKYRKRAYLA